MATDNYGATFTKGGTSIGNCVVVDYPEIKRGAVNATHHGSGNYSEFIPVGSITLGEFSLSVIVASGVLPAMLAEKEAGTISECVIVDAVDTFTFDGFYTSVKPEAADAQNPDMLKATVTIQPTGELDIVSL